MSIYGIIYIIIIKKYKKYQIISIHSKEYIIKFK
jgi:hypothetical protein